ncbi:hypothetical protein CDAR_32511 [Caerostris darwini]|uniref:Uncharacterized protein n=1 Tax=Caerostris darwini TaxID=1538125 RepID=A0AAV4WM73_9ARAC|nr:hypothetical protein CDAR_32511 [Caerostris darwini]
MKVLFVIIFFGVLGSLSCSANMVCIEAKLADCLTYLFRQYKENLFCMGINEFLGCVSNGSRECNVEESNPITQNMLNSYKLMCTEGTELNILYKKHASCVLGSKTILKTRVCYFPFENKISALNSSLSYEEKFLMFSCK